MAAARKPLTCSLLPPTRSPGGFTLVELLIAIFIFSLIGLGSWQLLSQAGQNIRIQERKSSRLIEVNRALNQIGEDLQYLIDRGQRINAFENALGFEGDSEGFKFVRTTIPTFAETPASNLAALHYEYVSTRNSEDGIGRLTRGASRYLDGANDDSSLNRQLIIGLIGFQAKYLDQDNRYHTEWPPSYQNQYTNEEEQANENTQPLPRAIHLRFELDDFGSLYRIFEIGSGKNRTRTPNLGESNAG